jgi:hypothetical protein
VSKGTSFDVLDAVCRQLKTARYEIKGGRIRFDDEPFQDCPAVKTGPLRMRLDSIESDAAAEATVWNLNIRADALPSCPAVGRAKVSVTEILDGEGRELKPEPFQDSLFTAKNSVSKLKSVKGLATFYFRKEWRELTFELTCQGVFESQIADDFKVQITGFGDGFYVYIVPASPERRIAEGVTHKLADLDHGAVVTYTDGREITMPLSHVGGGASPELIQVADNLWRHADAATYKFDRIDLLPREKCGIMKRLKLRVCSYSAKNVPFEFKDVKLR